jgi:hypothetical protein
LFLTERLDFESVFKIRHLSNAKYYRKWINEVGENSNAQEVSQEYLNQVKGDTKFFEKAGGKLLKNLSLFGLNAALGSAITGPVGTVAGFAILLTVKNSVFKFRFSFRKKIFVVFVEIRTRIHQNCIIHCHVMSLVFQIPFILLSFTIAKINYEFK